MPDNKFMHDGSKEAVCIDAGVYMTHARIKTVSKIFGFTLPNVNRWLLTAP